ncbi:pyridoxal-phosphate-dependent aminotransferase family protein [Burkholderia paludis]|uniref:pyridoxal-phosphate-dependent aminotransferase family protein n=1 Tax=Burkholderia paludis TaxID=1506587 RepID=UPI0007C7F401|nr:aminotransferase class V-fold PLP-dependent enzyme [Burkholderia paludis]
MIEARSCPPLQQGLFRRDVLLMGAGPVPQPLSVRQANMHVASHLGPDMNDVLDQLKDMARYAFQTATPWILGLAGPGSAAGEMALANLANARSRVLAVVGGHFGARLAEMAARLQAGVEVFRFDGHARFPIDRFEQHLARYRPDLVTVVHGETSSTTINHALPAIAALCGRYDALSVVDAVCTVGTTALPMDAWQLDAVFCGGQKGLSSIPGVSLVAFSDRAWERIARRDFRPAHWCLDAALAQAFWHERRYHYTAPVNGLFALHEALRLLNEETLPARIERHRASSAAVQEALPKLGLTLAAPPPTRLHSVIGFHLPDGLQPDAFVARMRDLHRVEISTTFGLPLLRVGQMGEQCRPQAVLRLVSALGHCLRQAGREPDVDGIVDETAARLDSRELMPND